MKTHNQEPTAYPLGYTAYDDLRAELFGAEGTHERDQHELELRAELLSERVKQLRKRAKLTQTQLGARIGVKKAQISKFEKDATSISVSTMFKLLDALHATVTVKVDEKNWAELVAA